MSSTSRHGHNRCLPHPAHVDGGQGYYGQWLGFSGRHQGKGNRRDDLRRTGRSANTRPPGERRTLVRNARSSVRATSIIRSLSLAKTRGHSRGTATKHSERMDNGTDTLRSAEEESSGDIGRGRDGPNGLRKGGVSVRPN
jgi:hypothetical protein